MNLSSVFRGRPVRVALLLAVAASAMGCHGRAVVPPSPAPAVLTVAVHAHDEPALARRGAVATGARLRLGFNAAGVMSTLKVKTGDVVHKGQVLARLQDGGASASLAAARATRSRALRDYGTAKTLVDAGSLAVNGREDARSAFEIASANTSLAAEFVSQRRLVSPINGTVVQRLAEPGEAVGPGKPVLVIDDTRRLVVKVGVTEREVATISADQPTTLVIDGDPTPIPAYVSSIGPAPLEDGLYPVEVSPVDSQNAAFRPGTLLSVHFQSETKKRAVRVPLDSLVHRDGKKWVFIVEGPNEAAKVKARELTVGREDGREVYVAAGIADGERIVREAAEFLHDGQSVRIVD